MTTAVLCPVSLPELPDSSLYYTKKLTANVTAQEPEPWQPQEILPDCWAPAKLSQLDKRAPILYYGYPLSMKQLRDYAIANNFYPHALENAPGGSASAATIAILTRVLLRLQEACRAYLYRPTPYVPNDPNVHTMVALYCNYTYEEELYREEDEKDIIEILQEELGIKYPPMWFWADEQENPYAWPEPRRTC